MLKYMKLKILATWCIFITMATQIQAYDFQYTFNSTQLPKNFTDYLFISTDTNATLIFTHKNFTSSISSTQLNESTNTYNLSFNISLPNLSISNHTTYFTVNKKINSTETFTNITFLFQILNSSQPQNISNTTFFEVGFNEYSTTVCDTALPFESSLITSISLSVDVSPSCDSFLSCPATIYPSEKFVRINISIPKGTPSNDYKKIANFGLNYGNITFNLKVKNCFFDVSQYCGNVSTVEQLVVCQSILLENLKKLNKTIVVEKNITEYNNFTQVEYKQILPLENETAQLLREFASSWRTIQSEKQRLEKENKDLSDTYSANVKSLQGELSRMSSEMDAEVKRIFLDLYLENQNLTSTKEQIEQTSWSKNYVLLSIFGIFLSLGLIVGFLKLKREMIY